MSLLHCQGKQTPRNYFNIWPIFPIFYCTGMLSTNIASVRMHFIKCHCSKTIQSEDGHFKEQIFKNILFFPPSGRGNLPF
jgi:hypothetical protein